MFLVTENIYKSYNLSKRPSDLISQTAAICSEDLATSYNIAYTVNSRDS